MSTTTTINLRFKLTAAGQPHLDRSFPVDTTVLEVKHSLFRDYPIAWPKASSPEVMRLIFLGKELANESSLRSGLERATVDPVTVHLHVPKARTPQRPKTPTVDYPSSPVKESDDVSEVEELHFHAVTVTERELEEFQMIFEKKKRASDGLMSVRAVTGVLRAYWAFIKREGFEVTAGEFPQERLRQLLQSVGVGTAADSGLNCDQFLIVFYLFDNSAPDEPCIHGDLERVRIATAQLHGVIQPQHEFYHERFEQIYQMVSGAHPEQPPPVLTCKQMELLYYMYSGYALEKVREIELISLVQARVRMRLARKQFARQRTAAKKLQTYWRQRSCRQSLQNNEQLAKFLSQLLHGQGDKPGVV